MPLIWQDDTPTTLHAVLDSVLQVASDAQQSRVAGSSQPLPVILVDEATTLDLWEDKRALHTLMAFFVSLTKEKGRAHVLLATSDTFVTQWLDTYGVCRDRLRDHAQRVT